MTKGSHTDSIAYVTPVLGVFNFTYNGSTSFPTSGAKIKMYIAYVLSHPRRYVEREERRGLG